MSNAPADPTQNVRQLFDSNERAWGASLEDLVNGRAFAGALSQMTHSAAALTRISSNVLDLTLGQLRLAGRKDIVRLASQLGRSDDKIERLLQEIESVSDEVQALRRASERKPRAATKPAVARRPKTPPA